MADDWTTATEESPTRMIFHKTGDQFIGTYLGHDFVEDPNTGDTYDYLAFRGTDGGLYSTTSGYKLKKAFENIPEGTMCRITYVKDIDMGDSRNLMKDFRVDIKK